MNNFVNLQVSIADIIITDDMYIPFEKTQINPLIKFDRYPEELYTIIVVDPDAPSPENPIYKYWLHLLIVNNNDKIAKYEKPAPPPGSGDHRYYFYLYKQNKKIDKDDISLTEVNIRKKFNLAKFVTDNNLEKVASTYSPSR